MIPHFDFPFRFDVDYHVAEVEQDTVDDIVNCVALALQTEIGSRLEVPTFGVPSEVFSVQPIDLESMIQAVSEWENRTELIMTQNPDAIDVLIARVKVAASYRSVSDG